MVSSSLFLQTTHKEGLEVLCKADQIDEYAVQQLKEFDGKKLQSTTKEGSDLGGEDARKKTGEHESRDRDQTTDKGDCA